MTPKESIHPIIKINKLFTKYKKEVIWDKSVIQLDPRYKIREPRDLNWYFRYNPIKSHELTYFGLKHLRL